MVLEDVTIQLTAPNNKTEFKFTEDNLNEYFFKSSLNDVEKAAITELLLENKHLFETSFCLV